MNLGTRLSDQRDAYIVVGTTGVTAARCAKGAEVPARTERTPVSNTASAVVATRDALRFVSDAPGEPMQAIAMAYQFLS